jgi:Flp pilus assembly protein TadD
MAAKKERMEAERDELVMQLAALEADRKAEAVAAQVHALLAAGDFEQAEAVGRQVEEMFPEETEGIERLAQVYESREMRAEAAAQYRRAIAMMDERGRGHYCDCCRERMVEAVRRLDPGGPALELGLDPQ